MFPRSEKGTIKKYQGSLVGAAVGDALGAPVEFFPLEEIKRQFGIFKEMTGGGMFNWRPGQTTDDSDMAMAIVNSVVAKGAYVPEDIALRFVAWMKSGPRDIGGMTKSGLSYIASGVDYRRSGQLTLERFRTAPNGSIMRTGPIGLIFRGQPERITEAASEVSAMTHAHPECLLACQMTSLLVADLASGDTKNKALGQLRERFETNNKALQMVDDALNGRYHRDVYRGGGYVFESFNIALHSLMLFDNFEDTLVYAVNLGGDADSQATVAGAFAGALYGIDGIPKRWKEKLNPFTSPEIEQKAEIIYCVNKEKYSDPGKKSWLHRLQAKRQSQI